MLRTVAALILAGLFLAAPSSHAQNEYTQFGVNLGVTNLTSDSGDVTEAGFSLSGNFFKQVAPLFMVGAKLGYNRWGLDEDAILRMVGASNSGVSISGSMSAVEVSPSVRLYAAPIGAEKTNIFAQLGFGLYFLDMDASVQGFSLDNTENKTGVNFGGGVLLGSPGSTSFELYPSYTIVFTEEESTDYFTFSLGMVF